MEVVPLAVRVPIAQVEALLLSLAAQAKHPIQAQLHASGMEQQFAQLVHMSIH
jgi:hypothetical protein